MNYMRVIMLSVAITVLSVGCASVGNVAIKEQSQQTIENSITKGKTTKQDVINAFGSADSVSFTDGGNEVWTYRHSKSKPMARNFIPYNVFSQGANIQTKELVVLFDGQGVVTNYTFRETANQSKIGLVE